MSLLLSGTIRSAPADLSRLGAEALRRHGDAALARGDTTEAGRCADRLLQMEPASPQALVLAGRVAEKRGHLDHAAAHFARALDGDPRLIAAHEGLTAALLGLKRAEETVRAADAGLAVEPENTRLWNWRGIALVALDRLHEAIPAFERAMARAPRMASAHWNWGIAHLTRGDFARGWEGYEARRGTSTWEPRAFEGPEPDTLAAVRGRRILCYAEQGLGDTMQFVRYAPLLARHAGAVIAEVQPSLSDLLQGLPGVDVRPRGAPLAPFDMHIPLMSLPRLFGTRADTVPWEGPYVRAKAAHVRTWAKHLGEDGFRIGVVWQGKPMFEDNDRRSFSPIALAPLAAVAGVRLIALQKGPGLADLDHLPPGLQIERLPGDLSFDDTAAVMAHCHLVVSACTSPAHLAGALGRPTWVALAHQADWRWMLERIDSPWYPTARLFRQPKPGDWDSVFAAMAEALPAVMRRPSH